MAQPKEVAHLVLPTWVGEFDLRVFEGTSGDVYLLFVYGEIGDGQDLLVRLHSACLTGDAFGSLRCDCGPQLQLAMRQIVAEGRGALVYAAGHEGRGVGLVPKLQAYMLQDEGHDTVDANRRLGLPIDGRDYREAAHILRAAGVRSSRVLTNNPAKASALEREGVSVERLVSLQTAPHLRNRRYVQTKQERLGHRAPGGAPLIGDGSLAGNGQAFDATALLGEVGSPVDRPYVVLKYAQTLDGRIAASSGDSKWISGTQERRVSHALRAASDAVLVGAGTAVADDPLLTVRMVPGASPIRVVLDSGLRVPPDAQVYGPDAVTVVLTAPAADPDRRDALRRRGVKVEVVPGASDGVELAAGLERLLSLGIRCLLVEGGSRVLTSALRARLADRLVVALAPVLLGAGTDAVGDLGAGLVSDGLRLVDRSVHQVGPDLLVAGDLDWPRD